MYLRNTEDIDGRNKEEETQSENNENEPRITLESLQDEVKDLSKESDKMWNINNTIYYIFIIILIVGKQRMNQLAKKLLISS